MAVNLRRDSSNFGKIYYFTLEKGDMLFIPEFFAHGYECLSKNSIVLYHLEKYRDAKSESGIKYNDKYLNVKWKTKKPIISKRDKYHQSFLKFKSVYKGL